MSDNIIFRIKSSYTDNAGVEQALNVPGGAPGSGSVFTVKKGEADARIFIFESVQLIKDIDSINIIADIETNAMRSVGGYWSNTPIWKIHDHNPGTNCNCTPVTSDWDALRDQWYAYPQYNQYLCVRIGASTNSSSSVQVTVNSISITTKGKIIKPTVQINYPNIDSCTIYNKRPNFQMTGTDPTNLRLGYEYRIDNSNNWINISNNPVNSGTPKEWSLSTDLSTGTHTLEVRAFNEYYTYSDTESRTFTYAVPVRVSANTPIYKSQMDTLKTYIDNISNYYGTGSDITITAPSQYSPLNNTNWDKYREKINKIPSEPKPNLNSPSKGTAATAEYYNSYITVLENG